MKTLEMVEPSSARGTNSLARQPAVPGAFHRIQQSIVYMKQHVDKPLQVAALAAAAHTSPSHYFALFKQQTGLPPICYFIRLRMKRACELLQDESLHIKEVAALLGYEDAFYFSRLFKSVNHIAPSEYRLSQRAAAGTSASLAPAAMNGAGPTANGGTRLVARQSLMGRL